MRKTLIVSAVLHAGVILWALIELPLAREFDVPDVPTLPIDIVSPDEFTKIKAGIRDAKKDAPAANDKPVEKPSEAKKEEPKKAESKAAAPPPEPKANQPEPVPAAKPEPKPEPEPAPKEQAEAPPPPLPKPAPPKPKVVEKKPEMPKKPVEQQAKSSFSADRIAALLNKVPDSGPKTAPNAPESQPNAPAEGRSTGQDLSMSLSELDALRAKISQCWIPPVGGMGAEQIKVRLRLRLNPDGTLVNPPEIVARESSPFFQVAADSALRAVWQCQPYVLPAAKYELWRDMILNFDPREMFGG